MNEGILYTKGNSFRAQAEAKARKHRAEILQLAEYDRYGHILTDQDAARGLNFLPSLRADILEAVRVRQLQGKGVDLNRTTKNMLSSQAMCFNLFVPLNRDKQLTSRLLSLFFNEPVVIDRDIAIECTPSNAIFGDQSGKGGVDCDALIRYVNSRNESGVIVCETKYVEREFSICGFRKSGQKNPCPVSTLVSDDFTMCRYKSIKSYKYWDLASESGLFKMDLLKSKPCPFGGSLWQLWVNMTLAYGIAKEEGADDFRYVVISPTANAALSANGEVFSLFSALLSDKNRFVVISIEDIVQKITGLSVADERISWAREFAQRYLI